MKQTLSITRATRNHSSFSWIMERFPVMHFKYRMKKIGRWTLRFGSCSVASQSQQYVCRRPRTSSPPERPLPGWYRAARVFPHPVRHLCANVNAFTVVLTLDRCKPAQTLTQLLQYWFHQPVSLFKSGKHEFRPSRLHYVFLRLGDERHGAAAPAGNQEDAISIRGQRFPVHNLRSAVLAWRPGPHLHLQQAGQDI